MKTPKFITKLSAVLTRPRPAAKKRLQASAAAARPARRATDDWDEEEPTTKLSSAFVVVLILHVVAVGGIYAFNSIKASRKDHDLASQPAEQTAPASAKVAANDVPAPAPVHQSQASAPAHPVEAAPAPVVPAASKIATGRSYTVKAGDNLTKISIAYSVTSADIMEANHLKEGTLLHPGQTLTIPAAKTASKTTPDAHKADATPRQAEVQPTATTPGYYVVKKGDTPTSIARSYGLTTEELMKANKAIDPKKLQPGQTLRVPPRKS